MPEDEARASWFTWEWVRDVFVRRGLCDTERANEIVAALEEEIGDPHNLLTSEGRSAIAAANRAGYTPTDQPTDSPSETP